MTIYQKRAAAPLIYTIDWGRGWLGEAAIAASSWSLEPAHAGGPTVRAGDGGDGRTSASLEGGVAGQSYRVSSHVLLSDGREGTRSLAFTVGGR